MVSPLALGIGSQLASTGLQLGGQLLGRGLARRRRGPELPTDFTFTAPGFNLQSGLGGTALTATGSAPQMQFGERFPRALGDIDALRQRVRPAFGELTRGRVEAIQNARRATLGNLGEAFRRRNVAGSTFFADALSRAAEPFARQEAEQRALGTLEELNATSRLIQQEQGMLQDALNREIAVLGLGANVGTQMSQVLSNNVQRMREFAAQEAAGEGEFMGNLFGTGAGLFDRLGQQQMEERQFDRILDLLTRRRAVPQRPPPSFTSGGVLAGGNPLQIGAT